MFLPDGNVVGAEKSHVLETLILSEAHDVPQADHLGIEKTYKRIAIDYFWPGCFQDIVNYIKKCEICQTCKVDQKAPAGMMGERIVEQPWMIVAADIMGPLPRSKTGYQYVLVIQDLFTKMIECVPLRKATGKKINDAFRDLVINRWGTPQVIHTDNGSEFVNHIMQSFSEEFNIHLSTIPPYHPQANPVERVNRVLKTMIVSFIDKDHRTWDIHISEFRYAYNTAYHSSLKTSPSFLNYGRDPKSINSLRRTEESKLAIEPQSSELWKERMKKIQVMRDWIIRNFDKAYQKQSKQYNLRRRQFHFSLGDLVLNRNRIQSSKVKNIAAKLNPKFVGPFKIIKILSPTVYEIGDLIGNKINKVHIKDLKPFIPSD